MTLLVLSGFKNIISMLSSLVLVQEAIRETRAVASDTAPGSAPGPVSHSLKIAHLHYLP